MVKPLVKQGNAYEGTLKYKSVANNNSYNEILHINLSEDKYTGPTHALSLLMRLMTLRFSLKLKVCLNAKKINNY